MAPTSPSTIGQMHGIGHSALLPDSKEYGNLVDRPILRNILYAYSRGEAKRKFYAHAVKTTCAMTYVAAIYRCFCKLE